jgi:hypothetical protein
MADYGTYSPVPLGKAGSGAAGIFGDGLGALRYLERTDKLEAAIKARAQAAAQKQKEADQKDLIATATKLNTSTGVHYGQLMQKGAQEDYAKLEAIATNPKLSRTEKSFQAQQIVDARNRNTEAGKVNDEYLKSEILRTHNDKRINSQAAATILQDSLYRKNEDGSLVLDAEGKAQLIPPMEYDPRATAAALSAGNAHLNAPEIYKQFLDTLPESAVSYAREALPGGQRGFRNVAKSNVFELTADGHIKRDPATNRKILRDTPEALAAFDEDALNKQYLDGFEQAHQKQLATAVDKMQRQEQLTPEEAEAVRVEQSPAGRRMELFKRGLLQYGYGREETALLQKPARVEKAAGRTAGPKYTQQGGTDFTPEVVGGAGASGTHGLLSLASSDPLYHVKADGTRQLHTTKAVHSQYVLLQNGKPGQLVTNNANAQQLSYVKPQLHLMTSTGNVVTPTDLTLEQRYQRGDRQPLLNWVRDQREKNPNYTLNWQMLAVPTKDKLTAESGAQEIFKRLQAERDATHKSPGDAGYQGDEKLLSTAQQLASQQGASLLVPYQGADKLQIDGATNYMLREPKRRKRMEAEFEYFNRETTPRPAEQRAATKKSLGINFGTKPTSSAAPTAPTAPAIKRAGTKKTGIQF